MSQISKAVISFVDLVIVDIQTKQRIMRVLSKIMFWKIMFARPFVKNVRLCHEKRSKLTMFPNTVFLLLLLLFCFVFSMKVSCGTHAHGTEKRFEIYLYTKMQRRQTWYEWWWRIAKWRQQKHHFWKQSAFRCQFLCCTLNLVHSLLEQEDALFVPVVYIYIFDSKIKDKDCFVTSVSFFVAQVSACGY